MKIKDLFDWPFGFVRPVKQALRNLAVWFKTSYKKRKFSCLVLKQATKKKVELFGLKQATKKKKFSCLV